MRLFRVNDKENCYLDRVSLIYISFRHIQWALQYDHARHESSIAQWLERVQPVFWNVVGCTPVGELRNFIFLVISTWILFFI